MSDVLQYLSRQLVAEKGFSPASQVDLPHEIQLPDISFLGLREYWGSVMSVGLTVGDWLSPEEIRRRAREFYAFTHALLPLAGCLHVGLAAVRLGSFGLLAFVFRSGCDAEIVDVIQGCKAGSAFRKDYAVCWALDIQRQRVHTHRGFPLTMFPGRRYFSRVIGVAA